MSKAIYASECEDIGPGTLEKLRAIVGEAPGEDVLAWRAERAMERLRLIADGETREAAWAWSALKYLEGRMDRDRNAPL